MPAKTGSIIGKIFIYAVLIVGAAVTILPFVWMILSSLKSALEVTRMPPTFFPQVWHFDNYTAALKVAPLGRYFFNTVFVTVITSLLVVFVSILAAFGFSRMHFPGRNLLFSILTATLMVPGEMLTITNYVTVANLHWIDTKQALIVPWIANVFYIYLLRQFFLQMPESLYYAAKVDACSDWRYLWKVMVPNNRQAISTIGILNAIGTWNAFLWPLIVTNSEENRVLSIGLISFQTEAGTEYELLMAAASMLVLPMVILYIILRKQIISSVTRSGIKG